jgi:hypothetical protein
MSRMLVAVAATFMTLPLHGQQEGAEPPGLAPAGLARVSATYDMTLVPPYVYALDRGAIYVLDVQDPLSVRAIDTLEYGVPHAGLVRRRDHLYLYGAGHALGIVDASDAARPKWVRLDPELLPVHCGSFALAGERHAVLVRSQGVIIRTNPADPQIHEPGPLVLDVLDLEPDPQRPRRAGSVDLGVSASCVGVTYMGERVYIAIARPSGGDRRSQLIIVDVREPGAPRVERRVHFPEGRRYSRVAVRGELLYMLSSGEQAAGANGLAIFRLPPAGEPELLGAAGSSILRAPGSLILSGDVAYASFKGLPTFATFDVSDPGAPRITSTYVDPGNDGWIGGLGMTVAGDRLYVSGDNGPSSILDVSVPGAPRLLGRWEHYGGLVRQVARSGALAIVPSATEVVFYEVPARGELRRLGAHAGTPLYWADPDWQQNIVAAASGSTVMVAYESLPAQILDISDPARPTVTGTFRPAGLVHALALAGDYAFLGYRAAAERRVPLAWDPTSVGEGGGLEVVNLADPGGPRTLLVLETDHAVTDVALAAGRLITAHADGALTVFDVQDPGNVRELGRVAGSRRPQYPARSARVTISADGTVAFLSATDLPPDMSTFAGGPATLRIFSVRDPATPEEIARIDYQRTGGPEIPVALHGSRLAIRQGDTGEVQLMDVADPARPILLARVHPAVGEGIALDDDRLYVGEWEVGVRSYWLPATAGARR